MKTFKKTVKLLQMPDPFSEKKTNSVNVQLTQLSADILEIIAKGERSVGFHHVIL